MQYFVVWTYVFFTGIFFCGAANILVVSPLISKSHKSFYTPLLKEMVKKGHHIVSFTATKYNHEEPGIYEIVANISAEAYKEAASGMYEGQMESSGLQAYMNFFDLNEHLCSKLLSSDEFKELNNLKQKFDLILHEGLMNECVLGIVHKFKAPHIIMSPLGLLPWINSAVGNPNYYSYISDYSMKFQNPRTFSERMSNAAVGLLSHLYRDFVYLPRMHKLLKTVHGPNLPPLQDIERNASLILCNEHFLTHAVRPNVPAVVDVGCLSCQASQSLPKDLETFVSDSGDAGFIYLSMGTMMLGSAMPDHQVEAFKKVFAKLPQRVIWKWEQKSMKDQPPNVKIGKWFPQQDILGHPRLRIFITHGGVHSTQEAAYHAVPTLVLPIFADQLQNANSAVKAGIGIKLNIGELNGKNIFDALQDILTNSSYKENAVRVSRLLRDQPQSPVDRALFWTEYVLRHKGARHLRSAAMDLASYQLLLLDIIGVIAIALLISALILYFCIKMIWKALCGSKSKKLKTK